MLQKIKNLVDSEFGDFFAGFGNPGEPETADDIVRELQKRMDVVCMAIFDMSTISAVVDEIKTGVENADAGVFQKDLSEYSVGQKSVILAELSSEYYALCCDDLLGCDDLLVCNKN
ncbi:hypothetical protein [Moritella viscosa]|uniref:Uncharacterized protein n=1 Tax=Moritella viscosa TaxID=80854 RepID=A0ABY1HML7_9GAMM|nr:hypothetical protein [Moritella viscosa]SGY96259.1 Putative uncharacterized protein [Moritella viscosa]SGZ02035.1 Putative uncharacterized protein [Moritella viscosa]SHO28091.1 Putative uncharacterized protein [Moritella viscosa]